jgi:segregation and condensation protein B
MNLFHQSTMDSQQLRHIIEAAIMAAPQPLALPALYALFPEEAPAPLGSIEASIDELKALNDERGVELIEVASGYRYQVKSDVHSWVARLWTERQTKYTRATLETLALIAYRQPITRGEIEQIRGVSVNPNTIKAMEEREWIRVVGHRDVPGKPALFGTTKTFLDYFGLKSLDQLPPLTELTDIPELDPQLPFDSAPIMANAAMADSIVHDVEEIEDAEQANAEHASLESDADDHDDSNSPVETTASNNDTQAADDEAASEQNS